MVTHSRSWVYYALGLGKEQLAVYNGLEVAMTSPKPFCFEFFPDRVYMYPTEYNSYANGLLAVTTRPDAASSSGVKEYKVADHLGSTRLVMSPTWTTSADYEPFGEAVTGLSPTQQRTMYIGKEVDVESAIGDFGFRRYDEGDGRFLSTDPLWSLSVSVSPYTYCFGDPVNFIDPEGLHGEDPSRIPGGGGGSNPMWFDDGSGQVRAELESMLDAGPDWNGPSGNSGGGLDNRPRGSRKGGRRSLGDLPETRRMNIEGKARENRFRLRNPSNQVGLRPTDPVPRAKTEHRRLQTNPRERTERNSRPSHNLPVVVPLHARKVLAFIRTHNGSPPKGYRGGSVYENDGRESSQVLPRKDSRGNSITYREYDVHPHVKGINRGLERLVIGSNGVAWYTNNP